jgi:hypothetical protein
VAAVTASGMFPNSKIDTTALKNDEQVRIIYFTGGPDNAPKVDYYYHYVVVTMQTNDTVNVLSSWRVPVGTEEDPRYFIKEGTDVSLVMENLDQLVKGGNVNDLKPRQLDKVISNRKYRKFEENNYPTIIGFLLKVLLLPNLPKILP